MTLDAEINLKSAGKTLRGLPQRAQGTQRIAKILQFGETCLQILNP